MAFTFNSKITKNGAAGRCEINDKSAARTPRIQTLIEISKVSPHILDVLGAIPSDRLSVSVNIIGRDVGERDCEECGKCDGCLKISREYLAEAGIDPDAPLEIFADEDEGVVVIAEACDDE